MWASSQLVELRPAAPYILGATIGHGDDMVSGIQRGLVYGVRPGLNAGLRPRVGLTGVVTLLRMPVVKVLLGIGLAEPVGIEETGVGALVNKFLL